MFCLEKRAEYVDVLERMILNVNLAAVSTVSYTHLDVYKRQGRRTARIPERGVIISPVLRLRILQP